MGPWARSARSWAHEAGSERHHGGDRKWKVILPGCPGCQEGPLRVVGRGSDRRSSSAAQLQVSVWIRGAGRRGDGDADGQGELQVLRGAETPGLRLSEGEGGEGRETDPGAGTGPGGRLQGEEEEEEEEEKEEEEEEEEEKVEKLIQELGLGRVADSKVGTQLIRGISGGERKRTNIGMELIIDPPVLFLDEPTTGLDASTANSVLLLLKRVALSGRTVVLSIHQPRYSIYRLFDSLTLLVSGKQVYHGPAQTALDYFSDIGYTCEPHNNPADFFLDIINGDSTAVALNRADADDPETVTTCRRGIEDRLVEEYRSSRHFKQTGAELERIVQGKPVLSSVPSRTITYNTGFLTQFKWVLKRTFRNLMLNPQTSVAQIAVTLFLALVVGAIFFDVKEDQSGIQNRFGALFFIVVNQCFSSLSSAELFIAERKLFIHEYISGYYRVSVYFLSKVLSDIITLRTVPAIMFSCVAYFMIGLKPTAGAFFTFMFTVTLVAYTATAMALAIAADQTVVAIANIFMTIACVFMMIFAGLLVNLPSIVSWLSWLKYLSIPRYGLGALQVNEFTGLDFCRGLNVSITPPGLSCTGEEFLEEQGVDFSTWGFWQNHLALGVMTFCFLSIAYIKLRFIRKFT
ncbi:broad substrate specificity ATP-binding cassette transporter ABCG2 isoform X1 [Pseudoliparis swirei]|uniref:broad substrate specificity ATP-binding cassette transporter ABCG2 isoform X1 n=1 Tax=Pseudoliparis swirei TaxID=2059687 RepID=UPI0024BEBE1F|nr:broad substrate specificity ATP-binding cassette transporter ABCG2 isoform X1 [Pseudoliparis swirei]